MLTHDVPSSFGLLSLRLRSGSSRGGRRVGEGGGGHGRDDAGTKEVERERGWEGEGWGEGAREEGTEDPTAS